VDRNFNWQKMLIIYGVAAFIWLAIACGGVAVICYIVKLFFFSDVA